MTTATPTRKSTARDPQTVELSPRADGSFGALSSDGETIYTVAPSRFGGFTCQCAGYSSRQTCCHTLAAALPRCWQCNTAEAVHLYRNPYEPETPITLCERCAGEVA